MTKRSRLFLPLTILLAGFAAAAVPALAGAETLRVDDNRVQCPLAEFTTLTAAVAAAANGDTIHVCAGTYTVPSGSPSSGLKIEKNLTIEGAGAGKVIVQPAPEPGTSLAQATPNPRDEYGNIITIRRRLIELTDVSISGLTVRANNIPVEAGIAMIDVDTGKISGVKVEGIVPSGTTGGPGTGAYAPPEPLATQGQGIIVANTIEETDDVTTIVGSEVKGFNATGVLVDNRLLDGSGSVGNQSHQTADIVNTKITGAGSTSAIGQTGIEGWGSGTRVDVADSAISKVGKADGSAAAVALHGVDVAGSVIGGGAEDTVNLNENGYGVTNVAYDGTATTTTTLDATDNYWGSTVNGAGPLVGLGVAYAPVAGTAPPVPTLTPVTDLLPSLQWDTRPADGAEVTPGTPVHLAVVAGDDFGVTKVEFRFGGVLVGVAPTPTLAGERLYSLDWTPTAEGYGAGRLLSAIATDSAGQTTELTIPVNMRGPARLSPIAGTIGGKEGGYAAVGRPLSCEGGDASYPAATLAYEWTVAGVPVASGPTYTPTAADQGKLVLCTVTATNELGSKTQSGGPVLVAALPALASGPTISGAAASYAASGQTLTCTASAAATDPAGTVSYQWLRDGAPIAGAVGPTYTVGSADELHDVACLASVTSAGGNASATATIAVGGVPRGGRPTIGGSSQVGSTLACDPGAWAALPQATIATSWLRDGTLIAGAGDSSYTLTAADAGAQVACQVTASNPLGSATATSDSIKIAAAPPLVTTVGSKAPLVLKGSGTVTGTKAVVGTISCDAGPCTISAPKRVKVKIGGKAYVAKVAVPAKLGSGGSTDIVVVLPRKARKALAKVGHSTRLSFTVVVNGGGGTAKRQIALKLVAAAKK